MGQAAVDLPDPLEPGASKSNADDLLAQLAGEEVDRLLAEADIDSSASRSPGASTATPDATSLETKLAQAELPAAAVSPSLDPPAPALDSRAAEVAAELEADEAIHGRSGATNGTIGDVASRSHATPASSNEPDADGPTPLYVRLLELLNAPVAMLPTAVQDLIGKIALLTLFNAIAVIVYVLFVRKH